MNPNLLLAESRLLSLSFSRFIESAWKQIEETEFIPSNHVRVMADHLRATAKGEISRLLINLPPECTKSSVVAIMFPAWVWTWWPAARFLYQSYSEPFVLRDATNSRRLIETTWYRSRWPEVKLVDDDNRKSFYKTTAGGYRLSTTRGSRATGEHPDFIVFEDPLSVEQAANALDREAWRNWYSETISSRGVARSVAHIISQQRLHPDDPSSVALAQNHQAELEGDPAPWHHVCLPMRYEASRAMPDRGYGGDWRKDDGELLFPAVFDEAKVKQTERNMGQRVARAQLQQEPVHSSGRFFDVPKIATVDSVPAKLDYVVRGVDRAATAGGGCYTAGVLLGFKGERVFILDVSRGQWAPDEVLANMQSWCMVDEARYGGVEKCTLIVEQEPGSGGKESAENAIKRLRGHRVKAVRPTTNKEARAEPFANAIAAGEVSMLTAFWNADFLDELRAFPAGKFKDQVDAAAGAYLAGVGTTSKPRAIMPGLNSGLCATDGCERPIAPGSEHCCESCYATSLFEDPTMKCDHAAECNRRDYDRRRPGGTSQISSRERRRAMQLTALTR